MEIKCFLHLKLWLVTKKKIFNIDDDDIKLIICTYNNYNNSIIIIKVFFSNLWYQKFVKFHKKNNRICQTYTFSQWKKTDNFLIKRSPIFQCTMHWEKEGQKETPYVEKEEHQMLKDIRWIKVFQKWVKWIKS